ncbi:MAG: hypothetical protein GX410_04755 [Elusimicrobia bacterium]|nr:hypothetical protein [Elusimicrobiota bacterium]
MIRVLALAALAGTLSAAPALAETLRLSDGSEIRGSVIDAGQDYYVVAQDSSTIRVPRASVQSVQPDLYYVLLKDGSVLSGVVKDISLSHITLETGQGVRDIERESVVKLSSSPVSALASAPAQTQVSTSPVQGYDAAVSSAAPAAVAPVAAAPEALAPVSAAAAAPQSAAPAVLPAAVPPQPVQPPAAAKSGFIRADEPPPQIESSPKRKTVSSAAARSSEDSGMARIKPWRLSAQIGVWKPGLKLTTVYTNNETISINNAGVLLGGRLMRVLGDGKWQLGADLALLSLSSKDYGTSVSSIKVSGECLSLMALAAYRAAQFGAGELYLLGGAGTAKTKLNYTVTPNGSSGTSNGYTESASALELAAGAELQGKPGGTLSGLTLMFYRNSPGGGAFSGSSSVTAAMTARLIWTL